MPEFKRLLGEFWGESAPLFQSTSAMFRLTKKLKMFKYPLRELSKKKFGDLPRRVKEAFEILCEKQRITMENPRADAIKEETVALRRWQMLAELEEIFFKQRSKLHWLSVGDQNTKAFHNAVKIREIRNAINELRRQDGTVIRGKEIKVEAERHFNEFLTHQPLDYEGMSVEDLKELLSYTCNDLEQLQLQREVTVEEVRKVIFSMPADKSPGPDGYTTEFFNDAWEVIGSDVTVAVQSFFVMGFLPKGLNSTILALILKKYKAEEMRDYRPISCCNVLYKAI